MRAKFKVIGIKSMEDALADAGKVMEALSRGEEVKDKTSGYFFTSSEAFRNSFLEEIGRPQASLVQR